MIYINIDEFKKDFLIKKDEKVKLFFCDINNSSNINIKITILKNASVYLLISSISYGNIKKNINIEIQHSGENSVSHINFFGISLQQSNINVKIMSKVHQSKNSTIDQNIRGIILSEDSSIVGYPILEVSELMADIHHSLSIGCINEDTIFYLMCKGFKMDLINKLFIDSNFKRIFVEIDSKKEKNNIMEQIKGVLNEKN
ncbi:MAG: SufD family Fe-S cluster assembly protein [Mycoplasmoidaceae bacterium]